jgi:hypothetical protein
MSKPFYKGEEKTGSYMDTNTLYVTFNNASTEQIQQAFADEISKYEAASGEKLNCTVIVNRVTTREGVPIGFAFVHVSNSAVYHMILGKKPDGTELFRYEDDPNWIKPTNLEILPESIPYPDMEGKTSWADMADIEDAYHREVAELKEKKEQQAKLLQNSKIAIPIPPFMGNPTFKLTPEQLEEATDEETKTGLGVLTCYPAVVPDTEDHQRASVLKSKFVPTGVTVAEIKKAFTPYASDNKTLYARRYKNETIVESFPFVVLTPDRTAFVAFNMATRDAQFALHMQKKTVIIKKKAGGDQEKFLMFSHAICTDTDAAELTSAVSPVTPEQAEKMKQDAPSRPAPVKKPHKNNEQGNSHGQNKKPVASRGNRFDRLPEDY